MSATLIAALAPVVGTDLASWSVDVAAGRSTLRSAWGRERRCAHRRR
jgi:hypothetical protein